MQNTAVVTRYHDAMIHKSADALADLYTEDAVHEFPFTTPGLPSRFEGREKIRAGYRAMWGASPARVEEIRNVVTYQATDPEVIVVEHEVVGTAGTAGHPFRVPGLLVLRVRDGRIVHCRDYMDAGGVAQARNA
ncbi:nuclear transport factor 2 family protein [Streptosporangium sp. NBC_01639]|uniref:nuclear transport factor 2 family protein n=1 Tax=Streptosporangium sp. NBC_01639 TaxID=2975948 RepID=UPI0038655153|nr:nuclear transport factor 2 family protein [Streptosporangium sp. NBC_01639]